MGAKPPVLQATQSGYTATYDSFDFTKACPNTPVQKPLTVVQVPDQTVVVNAGFSYFFGNYFSDPTIAPAYQSSLTFQASGLPAALTFIPPQNVSTTNPGFGFYGILSSPAVYTVTVSASNGCLPAASTTFKLIVSPASTTTPLTLTQPTYNCATGAFTFNFAGGDGSPVEFQAAGITGWTTNRNQFVDKDSRTASDVKPFTLMARQSGQMVTYTWDLKESCGRSARMAAIEAGQPLELMVKSNPVGNTAAVEIRGVEGQPVQLDLLNASGQLLEQRHIEQASAVDEQRFDVQRQPTGMLFLRAQSGQQTQTIKLIKQ